MTVGTTQCLGVASQVTPFTRDLAWEDLPSRVRRHVALLLLDHVAVCEAGLSAPAAQIALDHASEAHAGDAATSLLDGRRLSLVGAAWANGVLANVLDYDDGHRITKGHPGAMVIPAALAAAESVSATPTELLEAIVVGYEVAIRAGILLHEREVQYHASAAWGSIGAAAAVARLLRLDGGALRQAIGVAEYHAPIALMPRAVADPAMTKDTCGWGALLGSSSALLARRGFSALDSEFMLARRDLELGERWELLELYLKPYPCCRWAQQAIDAALRLRADGADPRRVSSIVVHTFREAGLLSWRRPQTTEEMQYSLAWPVATALARGAFGVDEVLSGFDDPLAAELVERMDLHVDDELSAAFPARRLSRLVITLQDGTAFDSGVTEAAGEPETVGWEDVAVNKARRFLDGLDAGDRISLTPPAGIVSGRSRQGLVELLSYGLRTSVAP